MREEVGRQRKGWGGEGGFEFRFGGGGSIQPLWLGPPPRKKGSIDGTPKILPRLTPGPRR